MFKLNAIDIADQGISRLPFHERCDNLNKNPVLVVRHFPYRVEMFSKATVPVGPLGKTQNYAIRLEFQVTGSPHLHSFIWILIATKLI